MTNALQIEVEKEWSPNHIQLGWKRVRNKWNIIPVHSSFIRQLPFLWNDLLYFPRRLMCKHTRRWRKYWDSSAKTLLRWLCLKKGLQGCRLWGGLCCRPCLTPKTFFMHSSSPSCMFRTCTTCQRRRMCVAGIRESETIIMMIQVGSFCRWHLRPKRKVSKSPVSPPKSHKKGTRKPLSVPTN